MKRRFGCNSKAALCAALQMVAFVASAAEATTYFVRASGDDTQDGLTPATARASIRPTARMLQNPGDRLIVGPGVYHEGNIMPRGSGTPDAPIVLLADASGELTGDSAGPVVITPPNTPTANMGFVVYGRHDIVIEGFEIESPDDPAIQIRRHSRTGALSYNITIRAIRALNGHQRGLHIQAGGDVALIDNLVMGSGRAGIVITGEDDPPARVRIGNNTVTQNGTAIALYEVTEADVTDNDLRNNRKGVVISRCGQLAIRRNQILTMDRAMQGHAQRLVIHGNSIERGVQIAAEEMIDFTHNDFPNRSVGLAIATRKLNLTANQLPRVYVSVSAEGEIRMSENEGVLLEAYAAQASLLDNTFSAEIVLDGADDALLARNRMGALEMSSLNAVIRGNTVTGFAEIKTAGAIVTDNQAGSLHVKRPWWFAEHGEASFVVERNTISGDPLIVGERVAPIGNAIVGNNTVAGRLHLFAQDALEVRHNEARGISALLTGPESSIILTENTSSHSIDAGLVVIGARHAKLENNVASDNADSGVAIRRSRNVEVTGNTFQSNPAGGISVQSPLDHDCNDDLRVGVDDLTTIVLISLARRHVSFCRAADIDVDDRITVDEVMAAANTAFERSEIDAARVVLRANQIEHNGRFGIDIRAGGPVVARDNRILNNEGIALTIKASGRQTNTVVAGNTLGMSGAEGLLLTGVLAARVRNNRIFSNQEAGVLLRDAARTAVINNLIYANGDDGISVGVGALVPTRNAVIANNTIYANAGWGVTIGTTGAESTGTTVLNNIIDANRRGGVAAVTDSLEGLTFDFNLRNDTNDETLPTSASDFEGDPQFVSAAGPDGILGGAGFADDDLHLHPHTPGRDAGSAPAAELGITGSAIGGQTSDTGIVDVGFHYGAE